LEFDTVGDVEDHIKNWAFSHGFELSKTNGSKAYAVYALCYRAGKPRDAEGKRQNFVHI